MQIDWLGYTSKDQLIFVKEVNYFDGIQFLHRNIAIHFLSICQDIYSFPPLSGPLSESSSNSLEYNILSIGSISILLIRHLRLDVSIPRDCHIYILPSGIIGSKIGI